jgi:hypothetical protein
MIYHNTYKDNTINCIIYYHMGSNLNCNVVLVPLTLIWSCWVMKYRNYNLFQVMIPLALYFHGLNYIAKTAQI